jgi:hypothetical protein
VLASPWFFGRADHWQPQLLLFSMFGMIPGLIGVRLLTRTGPGWKMVRSFGPGSQARVYGGVVHDLARLPFELRTLARSGLLAGEAGRDQTITVLEPGGVVLDVNGARCGFLLRVQNSEVAATPNAGFLVPLLRQWAEIDGKEVERKISQRSLRADELEELRGHLRALILYSLPYGLALALLIAGMIFIALLSIAVLATGREQTLREWGFGARLPVGLGVVTLVLYLERMAQWARLIAKDLRLGKCLVVEYSHVEDRWEWLNYSKLAWSSQSRPGLWRSQPAARRLAVFMRRKPPVRSYLRPG